MKKANILIILLLFSNYYLCAQWSLVNTGVNSFLFGEYFFDIDTGFVFGDNVILKTNDGGNTWNFQVAPINTEYTSMDFYNNTDGILVGDAGVILRTNNQGQSWSLSNSNCTNLIYDVEYIDSVNVVAVGRYATILKSGDGGINWLELPKPTLFNDTNYEFRSVVFINDTVGFASGGPNNGYAGIVAKSVDGGNSWATVFQAFPFPQFTQVEFINDTIAIASGSCHVNNPQCTRSKVLKSIDGGNSWQIIYSDIALEFRSLDIINEQIYAVGYGIPTIVNSSNLGISWNYQSPLSVTYPFYVHFVDSLVGYIVGDSGKVLKTVNGGVGMEEWINSNERVNVYPNPGTGNFTIEMDPKSQISSWRVYDIYGRNCDVVVITMANKMNLLMSGYRSGIYFITVVTDEGIESTKKIVVRE